MTPSVKANERDYTRSGKLQYPGRQVGETMFAADAASRETMGMELVSCEPGRAVLRMACEARHLNGHKICHGGFIFTLADSTFAFACNSHNQATWRPGAASNFSSPANWAMC
jgi:acyl-CoA thioesterase